MAQLENGYFKIANEIYDAFSKTKIGGEPRQLLDFIIRKTYGFNKKQDTISTSQIMEATGMNRVAVYRARKWLKDRGIITIYKNVDSNFLTYSFQKDCKKWKVSTKLQTVYKNGIKVSTKTAYGCLQKRHTVLITKDNITKDNQKTVEAKTPQARFLESFAGLYENQTGHPFKSDKKHFVIVSNLIKKYGYEATVEKAKILAVYCQQGEIWFCKGGWADFTPEKLSSQWNSIIPTLTEEQKKEKKYRETFKKAEEERKRTDELLKASTHI